MSNKAIFVNKNLSSITLLGKFSEPMPFLSIKIYHSSLCQVHSARPYYKAQQTGCVRSSHDIISLVRDTSIAGMPLILSVTM